MMVPLRLEAGIRRRAWMFGDMAPGVTVGAGFSFISSADAGAPGPADGVDVPLSQWIGGSWPFGVTVGSTNGISFGDYDADGWPDMFTLQGGNLFRNVDGQDWVVTVNLKAALPFADRRYGTSFGDYDNDGLPDIGCEPRDFPGDTCFHLFHNLGGGPNFMDVAGDPAVIDVQACNSHAESICWGDTDGDGNMDMFLPVYPAFHFGGPGNFFYYNLGPVGPGGAYAFQEQIVPSGLDNPPGTSRPEGAQFVDTDFDGDFDLFCNGTLYRNISTPGTALFDNATPNTGIQFSNQLEEGITYLDADLDGDFDLLVVYTNGAIGVRLYEAKGDGTFDLLPTSVIDSFSTGLDLGVSTEDWDNDGDMDVTTRQVFRRNQFMETGTTKFTVASHSIPGGFITSATPAWGDWDKDGDMDCALGNWLSSGHFYENTTYGAATPENDRRYLRVRVMRDSDTVPFGLENEYGAIVEVQVEGEEKTFRRKKFVSSSGGYLTQDEYTLHFAMPDDPAPADPTVDVVTDVTVDLAGPPGMGFLRIDKHVNPVLGGIQLAELADREIVVYRSGKVIIDGCTFDPTPVQPIELLTTTGGLITPGPLTSVPALAAVAPNHFIGIEVDTFSTTEPVRLNEIIVDGTLDSSDSCSGEAGTIDIWDVSTPGSPVQVSNARIDQVSVSTNDRSYYRTNVILDPGKTYRIVAKVTETRSTSITAPVATGALTVNGGLSFTDSLPCLGLNVSGAILDLNAVSMAVRFSETVGAPFVDMGSGLAGAGGIPALSGTGSLEAGSAYSLDVTGAASSAPAAIAIGASADWQVLFGGTIVPALDAIFAGLTTTGSGTMNLNGTWPATAPPGVSFYYQIAIIDAGAPLGVAFTNAIAGSTQP